MNIKYFGNSLDLMKYDLLTCLLKGDKMLLFYIPMLTEPQEKVVDPKYLTYEIGVKNRRLYKFMTSVYEKSDADFIEITDYFESSKFEYRLILPLTYKGKHIINIDSIEYFSDQVRERYFQESFKISQELNHSKLIFIDPDVGSDLMIKRRFRSKKDAYVKIEEVKSCVSMSGDNDIVCFFQHLGNNRYPLEDRLMDLKKEFGEFVLIVGYQKILGSLIFIFKNSKQYERYKDMIEVYMKDYRNDRNSKQIIIK